MKDPACGAAELIHDTCGLPPNSAVASMPSRATRTADQAAPGAGETAQGAGSSPRSVERVKNCLRTHADQTVEMQATQTESNLVRVDLLFLSMLASVGFA